jgi:hypothetical protein
LSAATISSVWFGGTTRSSDPWKKITGAEKRSTWLMGERSAADRVDAPCDLVSRHYRNLREIRIKTQSTHDVGEVDAAGFDANA